MKLIISEKIKEKGSTLQEVADKLGVARSTLANTINKDNPTLLTMERIASVLGISIFELFEESMLKDYQRCPHCGKPIIVKIEKPDN